MITKGYIDSFINRDDALEMFDSEILQAINDGWDIDQAEIRFVNYSWRVGLTFVKESNGTGTKVYSTEETQDDEDSFDGPEADVWEDSRFEGVPDEG